MDTQQGVSAIIYDKRGSYIFFLILHRVKEWTGWEFPKGKLEAGETADQAVMREVAEETQLKRFDVKGKLTSKREFTNNDKQYSFDVYLVEANMNTLIDVKQDDGTHDNYLWTKKESVLEKLYWPEEKEMFLQAVAVLESRDL